MLEVILPGPQDPLSLLKKAADEDKSPQKVDVGVGVYRNEDGKYQELETLKWAKAELDGLDLGHDYEFATGDSEFLRLAAGVVFGEDKALQLGQIASVQTISGTGAIHMTAMLLSTMEPKPLVYVGVPTWGNTIPIMTHAGLETITYPYLDARNTGFDLAACIDNIRNAPCNSSFYFQACCHNPTGTDISESQWRALGVELKAKSHLAIIDIAYQGLGSGLEEDAIGVRVFSELGLEMLVCQSFSKNFALYGERCGALHVVAQSPHDAANAQARLASLIRSEISSSPAYGSRLVKLILRDECKRSIWEEEISAMRARLQRNRRLLHEELDVLKTPGEWGFLITDQGLFSCLDFSPSQCRRLAAQYHVHLPMNGRINVAGLNMGNMKRTAAAIDAVARVAAPITNGV